MLAIDRPRHEFLGASDLGTAFSYDFYKTSRELWMQKTGRLQDDASGPQIDRGRLLEPVVKAHVLPRRADVVQVIDTEGEFYVLDDNPTMGCHPDSWIRMDTWGSLGVAEIKCPNHQVFNQIKEDGLPRINVLQLMATMGITHSVNGVFAVHCADSWTTLVFPLEFDAEVFEWLMENGMAWWDKHVIADTPPDEFYETTKEPSIPHLRGDLIHDDCDTWEDLLDQFITVRQLKRRLKSTEEELLPKVVAYVQASGHKGIEHDRGKVILITAKGRDSFDQDALAQLGALDPVAVEAAILEHGHEPTDVGPLLAHLKQFCRINPRSDRFKKRGKPYRYAQLYASKDELDDL